MYWSGGAHSGDDAAEKTCQTAGEKHMIDISVRSGHLRPSRARSCYGDWCDWSGMRKKAHRVRGESVDQWERRRTFVQAVNGERKKVRH